MTVCYRKCTLSKTVLSYCTLSFNWTSGNYQSHSRIDGYNSLLKLLNDLFRKSFIAITISKFYFFPFCVKMLQFVHHKPLCLQYLIFFHNLFLVIFINVVQYLLHCFLQIESSNRLEESGTPTVTFTTQDGQRRSSGKQVISFLVATIWFTYPLQLTWS